MVGRGYLGQVAILCEISGIRFPWTFFVYLGIRLPWTSGMLTGIRLCRATTPLDAVFFRYSVLQYPWVAMLFPVGTMVCEGPDRAYHFANFGR